MKTQLDIQHKGLDLEKIESYLHETNFGTIRVSSNMIKSGFWGLEASLIQLIVTWMRKNPQGILKTRISETHQETQLSEYGEKLHCIIALWLANTIHRADGSEIKWRQANDYSRELLLNMNSCEVSSKVSIHKTSQQFRKDFKAARMSAQFLCLKPARVYFLNSLYKDGKLRSQKVFDRLVKTTLGFSRNGLPREVEECISSMLFEMFENTHQHGQRDEKGNEYGKNVRGFLLKEHSNWNEHSHLDVLKGDNPRLDDYIDFCSEAGSGNIVKFLELSIFDGGLGMAKSISNLSLNEISVDEEKDLVTSCFFNGVTAKADGTRGVGLYDCWKDLIKLNAFIRVRTGRVSLFQVFHDLSVMVEQTTGAEVLEQKPSFETWNNKNKEVLAEVAGSTITIVIPLNIKGNE